MSTSPTTPRIAPAVAGGGMLDPADHDTGFMLAVAVRYCLGRHSYAPGLCCDWLRQHWGKLPAREHALIARDIAEHIASEKRAADIRPDLMAGVPGWETDLRTWERMLAWIEVRRGRGEREGERDA